jgi:hypothetical protein
MKYTLYIRRGQLINDDPQKRCYNGCYFKSHMEWSDWELWIRDYFFSTKESAEYNASLFVRENQQFKVVEVQV